MFYVADTIMKFILTFMRDRLDTFTYELFSESLADADRRGQNLQVLFDATLIDVYPVC